MNIFTESKKIFSILKKEGFSKYLNHKNLIRLKGISYLSTINYIDKKSIVYNRYEHSLSVAYVSLIMAKKLELNINQLRTLVIMSLIHDIGHVSFSHASETFILEKFRKYHHGLIHYFLREKKDLYDISIEELIESENDEVKNNIYSLVHNRETDDKIVNQIYYSSINADRIEGTNRSLYALGESYIDPLSLIDVFEIHNNELYIKYNMIKNIYKFWESMTELYNKHIYNFEVLVCEAMLTRALEITFKLSENYQFAFLSDDEVIKEIKKNNISKELIESIIESSYFKSCKNDFPDLVFKYEKKFREYRWNQIERKNLEQEVANILNIKSDYVISHFSYKKYFYIDKNEIRQFTLFDNPDLIHINKLDNSIYKKNVQGDVFDIFYRNT